MSIKHKKSRVAIAVCSFELAGRVPDQIRLIPAGAFRARDGRADSAPDYRIDADIAARVLARLKSRVGDIVIDYEHQTLHAEKNGQPAPAAGWFSGASVEWRGDGLWATGVRWTEAARLHIEASEYRYLSPVFQFDTGTGEVLDVLMMALTNFPAIDGHGDLAKVAALRFSLTHEDDSVNKEQLIALLGLSADATDEQIAAGMVALKASADQVGVLQAEVTALKAKADPATSVPLAQVDELKGQIAALTAKINTGEVEALIQSGIEAGKILPVQVDWARDLGASNVAALKSYIDKTPAIPGLAGSQTAGQQAPATGSAALDKDTLAVCKAMGISPDDYQKTLTEGA